MKDRTPLYRGRVTLTPVSGADNTYDMERADEPVEEGTPLNKENLLSDATAESLGFNTSEDDPTVNDALYYLGSKVYTHPTVTASDTTSSATLSFGGKIPAVDSVTRDESGHVTGINTKTFTLPSAPTSVTSATRLAAERLIDGVTFDGASDIGHLCVADMYDGSIGIISANNISGGSVQCVDGAIVTVFMSEGMDFDSNTVYLDVDNQGGFQILNNMTSVTADSFTENSFYIFVFYMDYWHVCGGLESAGSAFIVTLTNNGDDMYTSDKTFAAIQAAYNAGYQIICKWTSNGDGALYYAALVWINNIEAMFSYVSDSENIGYIAISDGDEEQVQISEVSYMKADTTVSVSQGGTGQTTALAAAKALGRGYGTCSTAAGTAAKVGTLTGFVLNTGAVVGIRFTNANTAAGATLNVNSTGAKTIYRYDTYAAVTDGDIAAGMVGFFMYNGSYWILLNPATSEEDNILIVTFTGNDTDGYECDYTATEIYDAHYAGKRIFAQYGTIQLLLSLVSQIGVFFTAVSNISGSSASVICFAHYVDTALLGIKYYSGNTMLMDSESTATITTPMAIFSNVSFVGTATVGGTVSLAGDGKITGIPEPVDDTDAVPKSYVDSAISSVSSDNTSDGNGYAGIHNAIYRGKCLGDSITDDQYQAISDGSFNDLYIGDYWTINGTDYIIAAFDYFLNTGATTVTEHHAVVVTRDIMYEAEMGATYEAQTSSTTYGSGYLDSAMYTSGLATAKETVKTAFGENHILDHNIYVSSQTIQSSQGIYGISNIESITTQVELMSTQMVLGSWGTAMLGHIYAGSGYRATAKRIATSQLPLFAMRRDLIPCAYNGVQTDYWLRDSVTYLCFATITAEGVNSYSSDTTDAYESLGVRPYFCIKG